jgi:deoxyribose-phosphate aldolase
VEETSLADSIVRRIDHAVLQPKEGDKELRLACQVCDRLQAASICVKPYAVALAAELLADSDVSIGTVIGFPHGGAATEAKVAEAHLACQHGAVELDFVINLGKVSSGDWSYVEAEIRAVVEVARQHGALTKAILETGLLEDDAKIRLCRICEASGTDFVKTSTGFAVVQQADESLVKSGATEHDVRLLREHCGPRVEVKASGGIRTYEDAMRFVSLGASRIGTSATEAIAAAERAADR